MESLQATQLLIAPPNIPDSRFRGSVILLTQTGIQGSVGYCLNKPTSYTLQDIIVETGVETNLNFPLYWGGPVSPSTVWMLHTDEWAVPYTHRIGGGWALTSNISMFRNLANDVIPREFRMFIGHSGWAPAQLECELMGKGPWPRDSSWLVTACPSPEWVFEQPVDLLWESATTLCSHQAVDSWL